MGYLADLYCEIAMEEFYEATKLYEFLRENNFSYKYKCEENELDKHVLKTIVFSAMTIESFLNNYVATCIGDSEFRENFEKLTPLSKLQLIVKFIFRCEYDSSKSYHSYMKRLFYLRNDYVHNKSSSLNISHEEWSKMVSEVISETVSEYFKYFPFHPPEKDCSLDKTEITAKILWKEQGNSELSSKIYLFQGLPKSDKMELVVQNSPKVKFAKLR